jgi:hypothetical protein
VQANGFGFVLPLSPLTHDPCPHAAADPAAHTLDTRPTPTCALALAHAPACDTYSLALVSRRHAPRRGFQTPQSSAALSRHLNPRRPQASRRERAFACFRTEPLQATALRSFPSLVV